MNSSLLRTLAAALLLSIVAGCAVSPPETGTTGTSVVGPDGEPRVQHRLQDPAVADLWRQAELARTQGQPEVAANAIERALRIQPADAILWSRLAELRLESGQAAQAENLAAKSNALAGGNLALQYRNWLIIGASRQQREDAPGAREAQIRSDQLRDLLPSGQ